jgi:hypothetical protein
MIRLFNYNRLFITLPIDKYNHRLLPFLIQLLLISNTVNKFIDLRVKFPFPMF